MLLFAMLRTNWGPRVGHDKSGKKKGHLHRTLHVGRSVPISLDMKVAEPPPSFIIY